MIDAPGGALRLFKNRQTLILLVALLTLMLSPGMRGRLFRARELTDEPPPRVTIADLGSSSAAPRLVHLEPGGRLEGQSAPQGWSHLVIKSVPKLATGDLDTVSSQAFETARRIRPVIVADIRGSEPEYGSSYYLARVGVGLCAPGQDGDGDRVVSASSVDGTRGLWTAKQRIILTAMAYEVSRPDWPPRPRLLPCCGLRTRFSSRDHTTRSSYVRPCWWTRGAASCRSSSGVMTLATVRASHRNCRLASCRRRSLTARRTFTPLGCWAPRSLGRSRSASCRREPT